MSPRPLYEHNLQNTEECLIWLMDCTLATVEDLAMRKSPPKGEFHRQIMMAQVTLNMLRQEYKDVSATRAAKIISEFNSSVQSWANDIHSRLHP